MREVDEEPLLLPVAVATTEGGSVEVMDRDALSLREPAPERDTVTLAVPLAVAHTVADLVTVSVGMEASEEGESVLLGDGEGE